MTTASTTAAPAGGRLDGEVALVTGAARNIGAAVAERLAADGAAVAVHYHTPAGLADARQVVDRITAGGGRAMAWEADVGREDEVTAMTEALAGALGPPTILVNNAAAAVAGQPAWTDIEAPEWEAVLRANVVGAFLCARAAHPYMRMRGHGRIIAMGSVRSRLGWPGNVHYTASKSALEGMTRVLARELGPEGITANTVIVGAIRTDVEAVYGDPAELDRRLIDLQAVKRRGLPSDVAGVVAFLASSDAAFITGQAITVDGGWVMS